MMIPLACPKCEYEWEIEVEWQNDEPDVGIYECVIMPDVGGPEATCAECGFQFTQRELDNIADERRQDANETFDPDWP